jgi:hypothetical protein
MEEEVMKNSFVALLAATVTLAAASAAYGQEKMSANVGFPFKMQSANLPAGGYDLIRSTTGTTVFQLRSVDGHKSVLVSPRYVIARMDVSNAQPRLIFRCNSETCALAEIWTADGTGYAAPKPKLSPAEKERLAVVVVPLTQPKAD